MKDAIWKISFGFMFLSALVRTLWCLALSFGANGPQPSWYGLATTCGLAALFFFLLLINNTDPDDAPHDKGETK